MTEASDWSWKTNIRQCTKLYETQGDQEDLVLHL